MLEVHQQLTMIRGQIEQAKGRMRYLSQVTAMSPISLEVAAGRDRQAGRRTGLAAVGDRQGRGARAGRLAAVDRHGRHLAARSTSLPIFGMLALVIVALWKIARRTRTREAHE